MFNINSLAFEVIMEVFRDCLNKNYGHAVVAKTTQFKSKEQRATSKKNQQKQLLIKIWNR